MVHGVLVHDHRKVAEMNSKKLNQHPYFIKADKTKLEREEYKRLFLIKGRLEDDGRTVDIRYGRLIVDGGTFIDEIRMKTEKLI